MEMVGDLYFERGVKFPLLCPEKYMQLFCLWGYLVGC